MVVWISSETALPRACAAARALTRALARAREPHEGGPDRGSESGVRIVTPFRGSDSRPIMTPTPHPFLDPHMTTVLGVGGGVLPNAKV